MPLEQLQNIVPTDPTATLASSYTSGGTSLVLTAGHGARIPAAGPYVVRCENEILLVTARSTDTLTVVGAQEGTAAANHAAGSAVDMYLSAESLRRAIRRPSFRTETRTYEECWNSDHTDWQAFASGGGAVGQTDSVADHPGLWILRSGGSAGNYACYFLSNSVFTSSSIHSSNKWEFEYLVQLPPVPANIDFYGGVGIITLGAEGSRGVWFRKLAADANWQVIVKGGATSVNNTGVAASANGWYRLDGFYDGSSVYWSINSSTPVAVASMANYETNRAYTPHVQSLFAVTASQDILVDSLDVIVSGLGRS